MIRIKQVKQLTKPLTTFKDKEWELLHEEHYGSTLDWNYWKMKHLQLEALEDKKIIGILVGDLMAGVLTIYELIIQQDQRGKGIGKKLMEEAEKWAKKNSCHEVNLTTGETWKAVDFYKQLGYNIVTQLPNHYQKVDFVFMRKFLS